jgi:hypothetical protein
MFSFFSSSSYFYNLKIQNVQTMPKAFEKITDLPHETLIARNTSLSGPRTSLHAPPLAEKQKVKNKKSSLLL